MMADQTIDITTLRRTMTREEWRELSRRLRLARLPEKIQPCVVTDWRFSVKLAQPIDTEGVR